MDPRRGQLPPPSGMRTGIGFDFHPLVQGRELVLGGVRIPFEKGLAGHSDADVVIHAACDALLGAAGLEDIGAHFPDDDPRYRGVSSTTLLSRTCDLVREAGYRIVNLDIVVLAEKPKILPYRARMLTELARAMGPGAPEAVNLKATTTEGCGTVGRGEGIGALATVLLAPLAPPPEPEGGP